MGVFFGYMKKILIAGAGALIIALYFWAVQKEHFSFSSTGEISFEYPSREKTEPNQAPESSDEYLEAIAAIDVLSEDEAATEFSNIALRPIAVVANTYEPLYSGTVSTHGSITVATDRLNNLPERSCPEYQCYYFFLDELKSLNDDGRGPYLGTQPRLIATWSSNNGYINPLNSDHIFGSEIRFVGPEDLLFTSTEGEHELCYVRNYWNLHIPTGEITLVDTKKADNSEGCKQAYN